MTTTARFVLSAEDRTASAIRSADRNLKTLSRTASSMRSMLGTFGLALSGRAFAGWISGALKAADATGAHAEQIKAAQDALAGMKKASDDLAVSVGINLTSAFAALGKGLAGLNAFFFNADPNPFGQQIADIEEKIREMRKHGIDTGIGELLYSKKDQATIELLKKDLEELIKKQRLALGLDTAPPGTRPNFGKRWNMLSMDPRRSPNIALESLTGDGLEEFVVQAREMSASNLMRANPVFDPKAIAQSFKLIKDEAESGAEFIGDTFKDSFADWMLGADRDFADMLKRMAAQAVASKIFSALGGAFSGSTSGIGKFLGSFFGGARASGGPVGAGRAYVVGERGPELFMPNGSGNIAPNGGGQNITVHIQTGLPGQILAELEKIGFQAGVMGGRIGASVTRPRPGMA